MASDTSLLETPASPASAAPRPISPLLSRVLGWALLALLCGVLADVLLEGWVQQIAGHYEYTARHSHIWVIADWPKTVKSALYLALAGVTALKILVDRRWKDFLSKADLALAALALVMVVAGLVGGSRTALIGQALFVYFRGAIVFYAWRTLLPSWRTVRPVLVGVAAIAMVNAVIAVMQSVVGYPSYAWFGWTDLTWARINRAQALFNHPNNLGHVLMIVLLGLLAWFTTRPEPVTRKWWVLFGVYAFALSATQSRESMVGFVLGAAAIWFLRRNARKTIAIAAIIVVACAGVQLAVSPKNRAVLTSRIMGLIHGIQYPETDRCIEGDPACPEGTGVPRREIRVLFIQQGVKIWAHHPVVGLGVGQFGGIVAFKANPNWAEKLGFRLHGAKPDQVDSFWLHLLVETGALGVLGYLLWLYFLIAPMVRSRTRGPGVHPFLLWAPAVVVASLLVALLSPSLEDPLYPPLLFTVIGLAWVVLRRGETAGAVPATGPAGPARPALPAADPADVPAGPAGPAGPVGAAGGAEPSGT